VTVPTTSQAFRELAALVRSLYGGKVTQEQVQATDGRGRPVVAGVSTPTPPGARAVQAGDSIPVIWEKNKPRLALNLEARRIRPVAPRGVVAGAVVEVLAFVDVGPTRSVWFANDVVAVKLDLGLPVKPIRLGWGVGANGFWVQGEDGRFYIFRVKRNRKDAPLDSEPEVEGLAALFPWQSGANVATVGTNGHGSGVLVNAKRDSSHEGNASATGEVIHDANSFSIIGGDSYTWTQAGSYPFSLSSSFWSSYVVVQSVTLNEDLDLILTLRVRFNLPALSGSPLPQVKSRGYNRNTEGGYTEPVGDEDPPRDDGTTTEDGDPASCTGIEQEPGSAAVPDFSGTLDGHLGILNATRGQWLFKSWDNGTLQWSEVQDKPFGIVTHTTDVGSNTVANLGPPDPRPLPEYWTWHDREFCGNGNLLSDPVLTYQAFSTAQFNTQKATYAPGLSGAPTDVAAVRGRVLTKGDLFLPSFRAGVGLSQALLYGVEPYAGDFYKWGTLLLDEVRAGGLDTLGSPPVVSSTSGIVGIHQHFTGTREFRSRYVNVDGYYVPGRGKPGQPKSKGNLWIRTRATGAEENLKERWGLAHLDLDSMTYTDVHPIQEGDGNGTTMLWLVGATSTHVVYAWMHNPVAGSSTTTPCLVDFYLAKVNPIGLPRNIAHATSYSQADEVNRQALQLLRTEYTFMPLEIKPQVAKSTKVKNRMAHLWDFASGKLDTPVNLLAEAPKVDTALPPEVTLLQDILETAKKKEPAAVLVGDTYPNRFSFLDPGNIWGYPQPGPAYHVLQDQDILGRFGRFKKA